MLMEEEFTILQPMTDDGAAEGGEKHAYLLDLKSHPLFFQQVKQKYLTAKNFVLLRFLWCQSKGRNSWF